MLKQYCLEGILAKESSPRTKDFLLWSDLHLYMVTSAACSSTPCIAHARLYRECGTYYYPYPTIHDILYST